MNQNYLVIDLEATCDYGGAVPKAEMEIIEIGAVSIDGRAFDTKGEFQTFVRPVRHPKLTPFCTKLTTITQDLVDGAPGFAEAIAKFAQFIGDSDPIFCSWGNYDRNQFEQDARYHGVTLPLGSKHLNLKKRFSERAKTKKRFGMASALRRAGIELLGTHHRGIDDARNIARLLPICVGHKQLRTH